MLEVDAAAISCCTSGAATASGTFGSNGCTAAPTANVSASLGGGGAVVAAPAAANAALDARAGGGTGLATDEVRASNELKGEVSAALLLVASKEEKSSRLTGFLAAPPATPPVFILSERRNPCVLILARVNFARRI